MGENQFILGREYHFTVIENNLPQEATIEEYGKKLIGESFLVVADEDGKVMSFVMTGGTNNGFVYKLIYSDYEPK